MKAPFDKHGLQSYPCSYCVGLEWRETGEMELVLTLSEQYRGRSAAGFNWVDQNGQIWPMFLSSVARVMQESVVNKGIVSGVWKVIKRGQNYGLDLVRGLA